jgi:small subunit ribosomal protein S1
MTEQAENLETLEIDYSWSAPALDEATARLIDESADDADADTSLVARVVDAEVVSVDQNEVTLKLDDGRPAKCPIVEASLPRRAVPAVGERVPVYIDSDVAGETLKASIIRGAGIRRFEQLALHGQNGGIVTGVVERVTRGGFSVTVDDLRAFLPGRESGVRFDEAKALVGRELRFAVVSFEPDAAQLVLSRRDAARRERKEIGEQRLATLKEGETLDGVVTSVQPFGAFVDIGGIQGLVHVSELSARHVDDVSKTVVAGQRVRVRVLDVDPGRGRVALSIREVEAEAAGAAFSQFKVDAELDGKVTRLADFGAFIEVAEGIEGLCHVSELTWTDRPQHPSSVVGIGDQVRVRVLEVDPATRRLSLSIRRTVANPWEDIARVAPVGEKVKGTITRVEDYGIFVSLAPGIDGLCHVSELSWTGRPTRPQDVAPYKVGDELEAKVLSVDAERRRIALGVRQLTSDPWDDAAEKTTEGAIFNATVSRIEEHAVWLTVVPGLEARMHISEISTDRIEHIRSVLRLGQQVEVMTLAADRGRRRLDVSMKAIALRAQADMPREYADNDSAMSTMAAALAKSGLIGSGESE